MASRKLLLDDIVDVRAYERERPARRERILALKRRRRVGLGPILSLAFENRDTVCHQIQEMARAERLITDDAIQAELDAYNPLVPEPGQLCATVFIELTSAHDVRTWLPRLVGIESSLVLRLTDGSAVRAVTEESHASHLTRSDTTAAVHYVRFELTPAQVAVFTSGAVVLASEHPAYQHVVSFSPALLAELGADLRPDQEE